jgi:hypothetical protein
MDRQDRSQNVFPLLTCGALIVTLMAFGLSSVPCLNSEDLPV